MNSLKKLVMGASVVLSIAISNAKTAHAKTDLKIFDNSSSHETKWFFVDKYFTLSDKQGVNQLQLVFDSYFLLKDALVKTDGKAASFESNGLLKAINAVKMET
jgi:hypothetical protein